MVHSESQSSFYGQLNCRCVKLLAELWCYIGASAKTAVPIAQRLGCILLSQKYSLLSLTCVNVHTSPNLTYLELKRNQFFKLQQEVKQTSKCETEGKGIQENKTKKEDCLREMGTDHKNFEMKHWKTDMMRSAKTAYWCRKHTMFLKVMTTKPPNQQNSEASRQFQLISAGQLFYWQLLQLSRHAFTCHHQLDLLDWSVV